MNIKDILLKSFNINEADNKDGTDNDGDEKVIPSDIQHGIKSKVMSDKIVNPTLQEDNETIDLTVDNINLVIQDNDNQTLITIESDGDEISYDSMENIIGKIINYYKENGAYDICVIVNNVFDDDDLMDELLNYFKQYDYEVYFNDDGNIVIEYLNDD